LYEKLQVLQEVKDMIYEIEHGWNDWGGNYKWK
jgi:hypothetical protein